MKLQILTYIKLLYSCFGTKERNMSRIGLISVTCLQLRHYQVNNKKSISKVNVKVTKSS